MNTAINLTEAELELVQALREKDLAEKAILAAEEKERAAKKAAIDAKLLQEKADRIVAHNGVANTLMKADDEGVFTVSYKDVEGIDIKEVVVHFIVGGREQTVDISEVHVKTYGYRTRPTGKYQYTVSGAFTDYKARNYKNPKSLVKKVVEFQEIADAAAKRKERELNLATATLELLKAQHPDAKSIKAYDPCKWNSLASQYYITFHVETTKGTVSFTSDYVNDELVLSVYKYSTTDREVKQTIADLILAD